MPSDDRSGTAAPILEVAHVLFMDVVAYSKRSTDEQHHLLRDLQQLVSSTDEFRRAEAAKQLIRLPTGDGMALVFFTGPEMPVACALQLAEALRGHPDIPLRMGLHSGPVYRMEDINANLNVAGGGINLAQRVMDCGDAGHILASRTVADTLGEVSSWRTLLHDLGESEVKHGVRVHLYNLYSSTIGNKQRPSKLRVADQHRTMRRSGAVALGAAAVTIAVATWYVLAQHHRYLVPHVQGRRSVAVLGFKNLSGRPDAAWLSTAFSEMLTTELSAGEKLRTVPGENVDRMKADLNLSETDSLAQDTLARIHANLGSDLVVLGSYLEMGGRIRLDLRLQDAANGETLASLGESGSEAEILDIVNRAGADLRARCGAGGVTSEQAAAAEVGFTRNPEATRLYAEGLDKLRRFDALAARKRFEIAVVTEPNSAMLHSALAEALSQLGYQERARQEARKARELSPDLPREQRLSIEGRQLSMEQKSTEAVEVYRELMRLAPDNLEYGLLLARSQNTADKPKEALATIAALRRLPSPTSGDLRIDLAEAEAYEHMSDFKQELATATRAVQKAKASGQKLLWASGTFDQGWANLKLGQTKPALALFDQARRVFADAGNEKSVAATLGTTATALADQGDLEGSLRLNQQSLAIARRLGDLGSVTTTLFNVGNVLYQQGKLREAETTWEGALPFFREVENLVGEASTLGNIAAVNEQQGDLSGAKAKLARVLALFRDIGDKYSEAMTLSNIADVTREQGHPRAAIQLYGQSLVMARQASDKAGQGTTLVNLANAQLQTGDVAAAKENLAQAQMIAGEISSKAILVGVLSVRGELAMAQDDFASARKNYQDALQMQTEMGMKGSVSETRMALAKLDVEDGHANDAIVRLRQVRQEFQAENSSMDEIAAAIELSRALLMAGKVSDARREIALAGGRATGQSLPLQLSVGEVEARIQSALGNGQLARSSIRSGLAKARKAGLVEYELEMQLALGEIELRAGNNAANDMLRQLAKDARRKGFGLIARKASQWTRADR